jgi:hypothetical protein
MTALGRDRRDLLAHPVGTPCPDAEGSGCATAELLEQRHCRQEGHGAFCHAETRPAATERGPDVEHSAQHPVMVDHAGLSHALGAPASVDLVDIARTKGRQCHVTDSGLEALGALTVTVQGRMGTTDQLAMR